jgi:hypothetical protein
MVQSEAFPQRSQGAEVLYSIVSGINAGNFYWVTAAFHEPKKEVSNADLLSFSTFYV